jgi:hypothetical protein
MSPEHEDDEPTQTTPGGAEIPVPERDDVFDALRKVARVRKSDADD